MGDHVCKIREKANYSGSRPEPGRGRQPRLSCGPCSAWSPNPKPGALAGGTVSGGLKCIRPGFQRAPRQGSPACTAAPQSPAPLSLPQQARLPQPSLFSENQQGRFGESSRSSLFLVSESVSRAWEGGARREKGAAGVGTHQPPPSHPSRKEGRPGQAPGGAERPGQAGPGGAREAGGGGHTTG